MRLCILYSAKVSCYNTDYNVLERDRIHKLVICLAVRAAVIEHLSTPTNQSDLRIQQHCDIIESNML